jgi:long-chain acyl-CoA synthetase
MANRRTKAFWMLDHPAESLAVIDTAANRQITYGELRTDVDRAAAALPAGAKSLVMLAAKNRYECLVAYLASLRSGNALLLADAGLNRDLLLPLVETYHPDYFYNFSGHPAPAGYRNVPGPAAEILERENKDAGTIHDSLALLLNTSGSTGSPKLVRLSLASLQTNAASIAEYLSLGAAERAITSLPMSYSYGLSVINSHLCAGACLVLSDQSVLRREFWDSIDQHACTSFAGVPHTYQMLLQTGLLKQRGASLRTLTQAGGALAENHIRQMNEIAVNRGLKFFVMYGQTEATARIAYVPFEDLGKKIGSIGVAVPGGRMDVDAETGELIYSGGNVMLGYAEAREDLAKGDDLGGTLRTGDLARKDEDGFFYITGRMKRFLKMFGKRFNLDEVEKIVQTRCGVVAACLGRDDLLVIAIENGDAAPVTTAVCGTLGLPRTAVQVRVISSLPRTSRGKVDYAALANWEREGVTAVTTNSAPAGRTMRA